MRKLPNVIVIIELSITGVQEQSDEEFKGTAY